MDAKDFSGFHELVEQFSEEMTLGRCVGLKVSTTEDTFTGVHATATLSPARNVLPEV